VLSLPVGDIAELAPASPVDTAVPEGAEVTADLVLEAIPGGVVATGRLTIPWTGTCGRCTSPVAGEVVVPVAERFVEEGHRRQPDDEEAYPLVDDRLDLRPLVRDAVLLELPRAPRCREDCRGLCPECGTDRNVSDCGCGAPPDPRWASLDVLR
jgi:uncharacterized protein